jgi:pimeloyl-ACP methyl ester carboxylesterase
VIEPTTRVVRRPPDPPFHLTEAGTGRPALVLHGGGGPFTVQSLMAHLSEFMHVLAPTHPGWNGTERPDWCTGIDDLADAYLHLLADEDLSDVAVVGSSIGGWIAAEIAYRDDGRSVGQLVIIDGVGIQVEGAPIRDFFALDARGVAEYAWHDSDRFYVDPATVAPEQTAAQLANLATMRVYAGDPYMHDAKLLRRLPRIRIPSLVVWGASDRIVTPDYGRALADALPDARFEVVADAGHLPHIEQPEATLDLIDSFLHR